MRYILYARKSSEDKGKQILSIESQIERIKATFPGINITKIFKESRSAYKPYNRPKFDKALHMLQEGKADGIVSWHPDRLSREPITGGQIMHYLDEGIIKDLKFCSFSFENSAEGKLMLNFMLSQSKYFSDKLSKDVKRGMEKKCQMGCKPGKPTIGYMTDHFAEKGARKHIPDPERYDLIRRCWDLILTGEHTIAHILRETYKWGLTTRPTKCISSKPLSKATIHRMFSNPYYKGEFEWGGEIYKTDHKPMVTAEEFERVQCIIGNRHVPRPRKYKSITSGLVKCPCGASIVVDCKHKTIKTTGEVKQYDYVRCSRSKKKPKCIQPPITQADFESQVIQYLDLIQISPAFHKWAIKHINQANKHENKIQNKKLKSLERAIQQRDTKLSNLLDLRISPENTNGELISDEEYRSRKSQITREKNKLLESAELDAKQTEKWRDIAIDMFDFVCLVRKRFSEGDIDTKKSILSKIGANLVLKDGKLHMEGKRRFIVFEKHMPAVRDVEKRGELEKNRLGNMQKATEESLRTVWSK